MDRAQRNGLLIAGAAALVALVVIVALKQTVTDGVAGAVVGYFL